MKNDGGVLGMFIKNRTAQLISCVQCCWDGPLQHSSSSVGGIFSGGEEGWRGSDGLSSDDHQLKTIIYQCWSWLMLLLLRPFTAASCWIST